MNIGMRLAKMGVPVVGIPKAIGNDLAATDLTFGLDSAVTTATGAIDALHSTDEAHDRVVVLEVMGREAGWIALMSGIAGGADVILIPEIPYDVDRVIEKDRSTFADGPPSSASSSLARAASHSAAPSRGSTKRTKAPHSGVKDLASSWPDCSRGASIMRSE